MEVALEPRPARGLGHARADRPSRGSCESRRARRSFLPCAHTDDRPPRWRPEAPGSGCEQQAVPRSCRGRASRDSGARRRTGEGAATCFAWRDTVVTPDGAGGHCAACRSGLRVGRPLRLRCRRASLGFSGGEPQAAEEPASSVRSKCSGPEPCTEVDLRYAQQGLAHATAWREAGPTEAETTVASALWRGFHTVIQRHGQRAGLWLERAVVRVGGYRGGICDVGPKAV